MTTYRSVAVMLFGALAVWIGLVALFVRPELATMAAGAVIVLTLAIRAVAALERLARVEQRPS
jgi:hypothetical protein